MSFGSRFMNVKPAEGIEALPFGEFGFAVDSAVENDKGTIEVHMTSVYPNENGGVQVREWFKLGAEASSEKQRDFQKRKLTAFLKSCGYADFALDPALRTTHKPLTALQHLDMLKGARCCARVGQVLSSKGYTNNEVLSYRYATKADLPKGVDAFQPPPRQAKARVDLAQSYGSPTAGYGGVPDYATTPDYGDEPIPHLPDGAGVPANEPWNNQF